MSVVKPSGTKWDELSTIIVVGGYSGEDVEAHRESFVDALEDEGYRAWRDRVRRYQLRVGVRR